ncbi:hypothetical protein [Streptomyces sp. CdTB01]|uniref:hypothetical protein n=1 Tax=Streptomyces sp. CdTB01 TaxID=1725411 RepID=UPI000A691AF8|nr:hypothetical protein [Streptomyces sp. CdTB01]
MARRSSTSGPTFREVLPALAVVVLAVCALAAALAAGYRAAGIGVPLAGVVLLLLTTTVVLRRRRPGMRRRLGYYTPDELLELDTQGLALAVARMLRRDGWRVRLLPAADRPRLCAEDRGGRQLDVVFRPVAEPLPDEDPPHPHRHRGHTQKPVQLIVHRGTFRTRDIQWARRQGNTRLLDGPALRRWAEGTYFGELFFPGS